jgi:hypothetical protein
MGSDGVDVGSGGEASRKARSDWALRALEALPLSAGLQRHDQSAGEGNQNQVSQQLGEASLVASGQGHDDQAKGNQAKGGR